MGKRYLPDLENGTEDEGKIDNFLIRKEGQFSILTEKYGKVKTSPGEGRVQWCGADLCRLVVRAGWAA